MKRSCRERILTALRFEEKTAKQLSLELFVHVNDIKQHLRKLRLASQIHHSFVHDYKTGKPEVLYSSVRYRSRYGSLEKSSIVSEIVGTWDSIDITRLRVKDKA